MQNFTYSELLALVPSYAVRNDAAFLEKIPTFIVLAENRLATDMKQQGFQTPVTGNFALSETMAKPAFWRETIAFSYTDAQGVRHPILLRGYDYCRNYNPGAESGPPKFYADYNFNNFLITPKPDAAYPFELTYYARLQPLSPSNESNWLTLNMPQALFAAVMVEACVWMKRSDELQKWAAMYEGARQSALGENAERLADRNLVISKG